MEQWLTRTAKNWISGPYSKEQVCSMIKDGTLGVQDEVCPANGYWILLHDRKEVFDILGIEVPRTPGSGEDVTESEITMSGDEKNESSTEFSAPSAHSDPTPAAAPRRAESARNGISGSSTAAHVSRAPQTPSIGDDLGETEKRKGISFIVIGIVILFFIALRAFR